MSFITTASSPKAYNKEKNIFVNINKDPANQPNKYIKN